MEEITCQRLVDEPRDVRFAVVNKQLRQFRVPGVGELDGQRWAVQLTDDGQK